MEFEFEFLSGFWPAYPDGDKSCDQRVWGYGDPEHDKMRGLKGSIEYILDRIEENGPFTGIVGFSSGVAITAVIVSLLENKEKINGPPPMVCTVPIYSMPCLIILELTGHF